jgi:hypothetical protein
MPEFYKNGQKLPSQAAFALTIYDLFRFAARPSRATQQKKAFKDCYMIGLCVDGQLHEMRE